MSSYFTGGSDLFGGGGGGSSTNSFVRPPLLTPQQQRAAIQAVRIKNFKKKPKPQDTGGLLGHIPGADLVTLALSQIASSLINTPAGLYDLGKAGALDYYDIYRHGDFTPERLGAIGEGMVRSTYEDLRHPLRNPGYALMDAFALASVGLGTTARIGRTAAAISEAGGGGRTASLLAKGTRLPPSMTDATFGVVAPDYLAGAREVGANMKASAVDTFKAASQRLKLKREQAQAGKIGIPVGTPDPLKPFDPTDYAASRPQVRQSFNPGPWAETRIPGTVGVEGSPSYIHGEPSPTNPARPAGLLPSGVEAGPRSSRVEPLFPRENTATLFEGQVPGHPYPVQQQLSLYPPEVPKAIPGAAWGPIPPSPSELPAIRETQRLQEAKAIHDATREARDAELATITKAPELPAALALDPRTAMTPEVRRARFEAAGQITPPPIISSPVPTPIKVTKEARPEGLQPKDIQITMNPTTGVITTHDPGGKPTGITAKRIHAKEKGVQPVYQIYDDGKPVLRAEGNKQLKGTIQELGHKKIAPESAEPTAKPVAEAAPPAAAEGAATPKATPAVVEPTPAKPVEGTDMVEIPQQQSPAVTIADGDEKLRHSLSDEQMAATGDMPATYHHVRTDADGTATFQNMDKKNEFKVIGPDGKELTGADWARHKQAAIASNKANAAQQVAKDGAKDVSAPKEKDLAILDEDVPPEFKMLGFSYKQREFGINPRAVRETFNLDDPQARELANRLHRGLRDLYKQYHAGGMTRQQLHQQLLPLLKNELGSDELGMKAFAMLKKAEGGVDIGPRQVGRIAMKAFFSATPRTTLPIESRQIVRKTVDLETPAGLSKEGLPEIAVKKVETQKANVLLSNNQVMRYTARTMYGFLQAMESPYARGGKGNWANRALRRKIEFEQREMGRVIKAAEAAGVLSKAREWEKYSAKELKDLFKTADKEARAAELEKAGPGSLSTTLGGAVDTTNQLAQIGILFLKPAYLSANFIGQVLLTLNDHSWNGINIIKSVRVQHDLFGGVDDVGKMRRARMIHKLMGEGFYQELNTGAGLSRTVAAGHQKLSQWSSALLDTPFRDNAFINEARRQGLMDGKAIGKLLDDAVAKGEGSAEWAQMTDIARRANRNLIDYGRLSSTEKQFIRRAIFFYPWMKGATIYGGRFAAEHPAAFGIQESMGHLEEDAQDEALGPLPSYLKGSFKAGERTIPGLGKVPSIVNPSAISLLGTPAESLQVLGGIITGTPKQSELLGENLTPALSAAIGTAFNIDPFTGRKLQPGEGGLNAAWNIAVKTPAPLRMMDNINKAKKIEKGELDPASVLFPYTKSEAIGRWLGPGFGAAVGHPLADYSLNPREARSRALAESRSGESHVTAKIDLWKDYTNATKEEAARVGVKLGPDFAKAMALKAKREAGLAATQSEKGAKLDKYDRLQSDLGVLVRMKKLSNDQAQEIATKYASATEGEIDSLRRDFGEAYFGQDILSSYKSYLKDLGAKVPYR